MTVQLAHIPEWTKVSYFGSLVEQHGHVWSMTVCYCDAYTTTGCGYFLWRTENGREIRLSHVRRESIAEATSGEAAS